jgi:hypothetical protein
VASSPQNLRRKSIFRFLGGKKDLLREKRVETLRDPSEFKSQER